MKIINLSYKAFLQEKDPDKWINGFRFFYGIWEVVARKDEVIFIEFIDHEGILKKEGVQYWFKWIAPRALHFPLALNKLIKRSKPDVVMVHGLLFPLQVILLRLVAGRKLKIVVQHHAEQPYRHRLKQQLQRMADRCINAYFFTAAGLAESWIQQGLVHANKVKEVMEASSVFAPTDKITARNRTGISEAAVYLYVGHLNANKDPLAVVAAFLSFAANHPGAALYMIFQSNELLPEIQALMADAPVDVASRIHLVGKIPHPELQYWFSAADFILSASHYEGSGVAVCEAMSCGCIPILSDIPSFQFMTAGRCGLLFEPGNEASLKAALEQSQRMDSDHEREKTLQQYNDRLSFEAIAAMIQDTLAGL